ncbi:stalk domain-containing protein [Gorillibacterium sp. CAU 1737]|uniref:stalk domain-containing protein n=1 Tax=Gorillibacterium sp. CAU 1737 TaxID=3140362 RepID=UPI003261BE33
MKSNPKQGPTPPRKSASALRWLSVPLAVTLLAGGASVMLPSSSSAAAANADVIRLASEAQRVIPKTLKLKIDGQLVTVPGAVSKDGGTTYVALRPISDALHLKLSWNQKEKASTVSGRNVTLTTKTGEPRPYTINDQQIYGTDPVILNGTTYVPLRFFLETFQYYVQANPDGTISVHGIPYNQLVVMTKEIKETTSKADIDIQYPRIGQMPDEAVQDKISIFLENEVKKLAAEARKQLAESEPGFSGKNSYTLNYFITNNQNGKLSLYLSDYLYLGGAHGSPARHAYTFDLKTGDVLTLKQAALNNPNYKTIINKEVKKLLPERYGYLLAPFESIADDQPFYLQNDAIVVYFEPYEYTPYAAGFPEFTFPLSKFR